MRKTGFLSFFRQPKNRLGKSLAFSLIELLISLITISVILASLAPVITHKMKHGGISIGTKKLSMKCPATVGSDCTLCLGNQCIACPIGCGTQFKNTLTCKCESCTQANCVNCTSDRNKCDRCKAGYQKSGDGCSACPSGYYSTEGGTCQKCPKGSKANATSAATGCVSCTGNQYQDLDGQTSCKTCNPGFVTDSNRACKTCNAGTYWNGSSCQSCPSGTASNTANVTSCSSCPSGQYQPNSGQTSCISCSGAVNDTKTACRSCSDFGVNCIGCNYYACTNTSCDSKSSCTSSQYYDNCHCQPCTGGKVPNANKDGCVDPAPTSCPEGQYLANSKCNPCPTGCSKCTSDTNCSECSTDYVKNGSTCKYDPCDKYNAVLIEGDYYSKHYKFCMKKYNAGDPGGPSISGIPIGQQQVKAKNACGHTIANGGYQTFTDAHCWTSPDGEVTDNYCTSTSKLSSLSGLDYEGCHRTVCNWQAAKIICDNLGDGWTLPSEEQFIYIDYSWKHKNDSDFRRLQLCTSDGRAESQNFVHCLGDIGSYNRYCKGSASGECDTEMIWGTKDSDGVAALAKISLSGSSYSFSRYSTTGYYCGTMGKQLGSARSVRCVKVIE